ncbi:MAG: excinuclease ABC subunit A [Candidatus Methanofastidiosum methylothiophilum]|uniref:UvrABC system protein A n=1 Tax=Candidatus Methanofastidiosum methylothiophilum TaxID=1705564 RepID=A0A150JKG5_9EURY|nr:MAG: excinuclease ABC subunit A [Candidatus Methanofastidiosum methylthiophilus]MBP6931989.1 excinuclease ABC subunit UvrA [Methanofastidiosum sp.]OQC52806.1 MAG: excinuclease ABC subunit A [Euryarchaeota archaeon ADurb.Bin023]KYC57667.1 MAG: excinuclease ABC subunit A [Candidatus Methanofastidiosum methylthiophilus]KYC58443.1 MAG: excinuclease ABC subunit A [Candidatus Methanofastidiosum methylthiophilus]
MGTDYITVKGASEHNLKNIDVQLPRDKLIVITGVSGSGKSSLAFDTIYAEGQRRYVESLSAYARQFLGLMEKPDVEYIEGLSPAISIEQKTTSKNPRSTVGTVTEIYDYLRLLYARVGIPYCSNCGKEIKKQTVTEITDQILSFPEGTKITILAPIVRGRKGEYSTLLKEMNQEGYARAEVDGEVKELDTEIRLERYKKHNINIIIDRLVLKEGMSPRLYEDIELALKKGEGVVFVDVGDKRKTFSENFACTDCGISLEEINPRMFSFNTPYGACPACHGLGFKQEFDPDLIIPNKDISLIEGAVEVWNSIDGFRGQTLQALSKKFKFRLDIPVKNLSVEHMGILLYGTNEKVRYNYRSRNTPTYWTYEGTFEGIIPWLERVYKETESEYRKEQFEKYIRLNPCELCNGKRLKPEALSVKIQDRSIIDITELQISNCYKFFVDLEQYLNEKEKIISKQILKEIKSRLGFLLSVGLDYLTLDRRAGTLSGGESQRIRLATQVGSQLVGVLYILDEPSIGLHQRDNAKLIVMLKRLRDIGNTVIVIEHDEEMMLSSDYLVDIGPGAGVHGGNVVAIGSPEEVMKNPNSLTGKYLSRNLKIEAPKVRKTSNDFLIIKGARQYNLKNIDVKIPLGLFVCVTGVSGSGKSTLINDILYKDLANKFYRAVDKPGDHDEILGIENIDKVIIIDQSPIGRSPRSNPATYTGLFTPIRELFSELPESKRRGFKKGRFSFNVKGGRCENCRGDGLIKIEMHFLPDVYVKCEECKGERYNRETLTVKYKGKSISDILNMTVEEALHFFENIPILKNKLQTLYDVGLSYIKVGQPATTLSGGEAQRVKLSKELSRKATGNTLYILDEPTTGLHFDDVKKLLDVLLRLRENGNTVLVIEHNMDVIKTADYIIDLGPEGGYKGGEIIAEGTPEDIIKSPKSHTGRFLEEVLKRDRIRA